VTDISLQLNDFRGDFESLAGSHAFSRCSWKKKREKTGHYLLERKRLGWLSLGGRQKGYNFYAHNPGISVSRLAHLADLRDETGVVLRSKNAV